MFLYTYLFILDYVYVTCVVAFFCFVCCYFRDWPPPLLLPLRDEWEKKKKSGIVIYYSFLTSVTTSWDGEMPRFFFLSFPPYRKLREFSPRFSWRIVAHHTQVGSAWMNEIDMEKSLFWKIREKFEFRVSALVIDEEDWQRSEEWSKTLMDVILFLFLY